MSEYDRQEQARRYEGWAFTYCKAALLVLIFQRYSLIALSALSVIFYLAAAAKGVDRYRCFVKPPWVTIVWTIVLIAQLYAVHIHGWPPWRLIG